VKFLQKLPPPNFLSERAEQLTETFVSSGHKTRPWAHDEIRERLSEETHNRCAYCEGAFLPVSYGNIEHILPKSRFPRKVVDWANLTLVCVRCNTNKGDKYDPDLLFLNPYQDHAEDHLVFVGSIVRPKTARGMHTIDELQLNDVARYEARERVLQIIDGLLAQAQNAPTESARQKYVDLLNIQLENIEYGTTARAFVYAWRMRA
jgi:hypothetical protein